jgi:hypothetical protein
VTVTPPLQPGTTAANVAFTMPYFGGNITISQKLPVSLAGATVMMRKIGDMQVQSPLLTTQREVPLEGGRNYVIASGPAIDGNGTLTFDLQGLPHHSTVPRTATGIVAGVIVLIGLGAAFSVRHRGADAARRKQLESRREKVFAELVKLEEQKRGGKIDAARHQSRRATLVAQLERIYGELDHVGPATGGDEGLAA